MASKQGIRHEMLRRMREAEDALERLNAIPDEDDYPHGTVLRITIVANANGEEYVYLFLKVVAPNYARWYHTGSLNGRSRNSLAPSDAFVDWPALVGWVMSYSVRLVKWEVMVSREEPQRLTLEDEVIAGEYEIRYADGSHWVVTG